jgi:Hydroxymethylpyrimidine/phosphomethylpyrimidine kinase
VHLIQWGQSYRKPYPACADGVPTRPTPREPEPTPSAVASATPPLVLLFGPFDPSGADGLPADAVTCAQLGCHAISTLTAVTVQDTAGIEEVHVQPPELLDDQARCLLEDMPVQAIKVGALFSAESVSAVAQIAADYSHLPLVLHLGPRGPAPRDAADQEDADELLAATFELLLPQAHVAVIEHVRLNQWVAEGLVEPGELPSPLHALLAAGAQWALATGNPVRPGHRTNLLVGPENRTASFPWQAPPERSTDTGGVLSCALAAQLAHGLAVPKAVEAALAYSDAAMAAAFQPGMGNRIPNRVLRR